MKLQMKREALEKLYRHANEMPLNEAPATKAGGQKCTVLCNERISARLWIKIMVRGGSQVRKCFRINSADPVGA